MTKTSESSTGPVSLPSREAKIAATLGEFCVICGEEMTLEVAQARVKKNGVNKVGPFSAYLPGVILEDGSIGHLECFVEKGIVTKLPPVSLSLLKDSDGVGFLHQSEWVAPAGSWRFGGK